MRLLCISGIMVALLLSAPAALAGAPVIVEGKFGPTTASLEGAKFGFLPLRDVSFSGDEAAIAGKWIGQRLGSIAARAQAFRGIQLTLVQDWEDPLQIVSRSSTRRGVDDVLFDEVLTCFAAWFEQLPSSERVSLLGNYADIPLSSEEVSHFSDAFATYIATNRAECAASRAEPDWFLGRKVADYLSFRNQNVSTDPAYDALLAKAYDAEREQILGEFRDASRDLIISWVTDIQKKASPIDEGALKGLFADIGSSPYDIPATTFVYRALMYFADRAPSLEEHADAGHVAPFIPYLVAAQDILNECGSASGFFAVQTCNQETMGERFAFIKVKRSRGWFTDFITR